jgi:uncharacterized protein (TIGR00299 family) protein
MESQTEPQRSSGRILYLDPWSGVSGDMLLGALLDLDPEGEAERYLRATVAALPLSGLRLDVRKVASAGIMCTRVEISSDSPPPLRTLRDLGSVLEGADLAGELTDRSLAALRRLAHVEAGLHGVGIDEVHFHEIGAIDTLVDVVGVLALVMALEVDHIAHGPIQVGAGAIVTEHGRLGVPAPAALELLRGAAISPGDEPFELTTPTGALLLAEIGALSAPLPNMVVEAVGYGGGSRTLTHGPNVLRAIVGRSSARVSGPRTATGGVGLPGTPETLVILEAVVDDSSPEVLSYLQQALLSQGALDAWWTPVHMKKGRLGSELTVLCRSDDERALTETIFRESTTFGVRREERTRSVLERRWLTVDVSGEKVRVKVGSLRGEVVTVAPEYEEAQLAAARLAAPLKDVMRAAAEAARRLLGP